MKSRFIITALLLAAVIYIKFFSHWEDLVINESLFDHSTDSQH